MKTSRTMDWLVALPLMIPGVFACNGTHESSSLGTSGEQATVHGTVVDAATGEPLSGIKITGPHGTKCVSGAGGRFALEGLHAGDSGEIAASASDGRVATLALRPLRAGDLEVVLRLARR
jgi:hypothetical protein